MRVSQVLWQGPEGVSVRFGEGGVPRAAREGEAVRRQLEEARAELLAPLRAASMESYARVYPHLVCSPASAVLIKHFRCGLTRSTGPAL